MAVTRQRGWLAREFAHWAIVLGVLLVPGLLLGSLYLWTNLSHPKQIWDVIVRQSVAHLSEVAPPGGAAPGLPNARIFEERVLTRQVHCTGPVTWHVTTYRALVATCATARGSRSALHHLNGANGFAWYQVERSGQTNLLLVNAHGTILTQESLAILPPYAGRSIGGDEGE
ncbi:hypothetical protein EPN52_02900 [bacterium]|nr:MAG: hypothetical protein EPN52_02900 [bacterium]